MNKVTLVDPEVAANIPPIPPISAILPLCGHAEEVI